MLRGPLGRCVYSIRQSEDRDCRDWFSRFRDRNQWRKLDFYSNFQLASAMFRIELLKGRNADDDGDDHDDSNNDNNGDGDDDSSANYDNNDDENRLKYDDRLLGGKKIWKRT